MIKEGKRTTIYLDPDLHKALKLKAIEASSSRDRNLLFCWE